MMEFLLFKQKPIGNPKISDRNYIMPIQCVQGWFVNIKFKAICVEYGWKDFTEVKEVTLITPKFP